MISQGHFDTINNKDYLQAINDAADLRKREKKTGNKKVIFLISKTDISHWLFTKSSKR